MLGGGQIVLPLHLLQFSVVGEVLASNIREAYLPFFRLGQ